MGVPARASGERCTAEICWLRRYAGFAQALDELPVTAIAGPDASRPDIENALAGYYPDERGAAAVVAIGLVTLDS